METDLGSDSQAVAAFLNASDDGKKSKVFSELKALRNEDELPLDEFGSEANRWFGDASEAEAWLDEMIGQMEEALGSVRGSEGGVIVKDSNGAVLAEGDSVQVIKDLKVKGGSSDLKRGTLIKKIHLIDDADLVECRVDGSTLVLKTCFLKKV